MIDVSSASLVDDRVTMWLTGSCQTDNLFADVALGCRQSFNVQLEQNDRRRLHHLPTLGKLVLSFHFPSRWSRRLSYLFNVTCANSTTYIRSTWHCGRDCSLRIGLFSHNERHQRRPFTPSSSSSSSSSLAVDRVNGEPAIDTQSPVQHTTSDRVTALSTHCLHDPSSDRRLCVS